jgi:hypothetical protein
MKTVAKINKTKSIVKPIGLFSFLPLGLSGAITFFFHDTFWPVALLSAPALWFSLTSYTHHARWEIARLYSQNRYDYDLDTSSERSQYNKTAANESVKAAESISNKQIYAAVFTRKPFDLTLTKELDENFGGSKAYNVVFDGKEVAVQKINDPSVFDLWEEALVNARKLK